MGTFSILFRMVLRSTPPIFSFVLIFSNLFPISTGLLFGLQLALLRKLSAMIVMTGRLFCISFSLHNGTCVLCKYIRHLLAKPT